MNAEFEKLEAEIDAGLAEFADTLNSPCVERTTIQRVQDAVRRETLARHQRLALRIAGTWIAAAAAVVFAVGLRVSPSDPLVSIDQLVADASPETLVDAWVDANVESGERFTMLYDTDSWSELDNDLFDVEPGDSEDALDSLEQSFDAFEQTFGV